MSPTPCEPLKSISPSTRKNSHLSTEIAREIPSTHNHLGGILPVLTSYTSLSAKGLNPSMHTMGLSGEPSSWKPLKKNSNPRGKLEIIFKHLLLREGRSPICNIWCFQSCSPNLKANGFLPLCNLGRSAMVISSPGVYMSLSSCTPQVQVGLPAEFSVKWSKRLLCYLKIEGRLTKHMGPVEPGRMIKKKKRHHFGGYCPNLDSL